MLDEDPRSLEEIFDEWKAAIDSVPWCSSLLQSSDACTADTLVPSWREAIKHSRNARWSRIGELASNELNEFVSSKLGTSLWSEYSGEWGQMIPDIQNVILTTIEPKLQYEILEKSQLETDKIRTMVSMSNWNIIYYSWYLYFNWIPDLPNFYARAFRVFQAGHVPCGWTHSVRQYPEGQFYYI